MRARSTENRTDQGRFGLDELDHFARILIEMAPRLAQRVNVPFLLL